eukprot:GHVH01017401.1.p1 GENE.GHVH01017401.1~~GHVH01017401.1.p1  ORF type:complete len:206 (+),score=24.83 GHVH01017401.1:163-780(+)
MSIFEYNGSACIAMTGKNCVAIASDNRLGSNQLQTVSTNFPKVFRVSEKSLVGLGGFASDIQTFRKSVQYSINMFEMREQRSMEPQTVSTMISNMLYSRRFGPWFITPVIAGLNDNNEPFISGFDCIGAACIAEDFIATGTADEQLTGTAESLWRPDLEPEDLFEVISQTLLSAVDRDCLSGWGGTVIILTPDKRITREIKGRMD